MWWVVVVVLIVALVWAWSRFKSSIAATSPTPLPNFDESSTSVGDDGLLPPNIASALARVADASLPNFSSTDATSSKPDTADPTVRSIVTFVVDRLASLAGEQMVVLDVSAVDEATDETAGISSYDIVFLTYAQTSNVAVALEAAVLVENSSGARFVRSVRGYTRSDTATGTTEGYDGTRGYAEFEDPVDLLARETLGR